MVTTARAGGTRSQPYAGTLYLLHLDRPLAGARNQHGQPRAGHYLGWTAARSPSRRVGLHARGQSGSKYMRQAYREGIAFRLVRTWSDADRNTERRLKRWKKLAALCPACRAARRALPHP